MSNSVLRDDKEEGKYEREVKVQSTFKVYSIRKAFRERNFIGSEHEEATKNEEDAISSTGSSDNEEEEMEEDVEMVPDSMGQDQDYFEDLAWLLDTGEGNPNCQVHENLYLQKDLFPYMPNPNAKNMINQTEHHEQIHAPPFEKRLGSLAKYFPEGPNQEDGKFA